MRKSTKIRNKERMSHFTLAFQHCTRILSYCTVKEKSNKRLKDQERRNKIVTDNIPGSGRSAGEGKGYPLQYSGLENSMEFIVHGVAKNWTRLSNFHFHMLVLMLEHDAVNIIEN